jgi:hypothetical protein
MNPLDLSALVPPTRWECPRCTLRDVTREPGVHSRFHPCAGMGGLSMPMVREGERVRVTVNEREDYLRGEDALTADGRPVMSVTTEHPDGHTDVAVYAPTAYLSGENS